MTDGRVRVVYRASGLGGCTHALAMMKDGLSPAPPPAFMLEKFQQGHDLEPVILGMLDPDAGVSKQDRDGNQYAVKVLPEYAQHECELVVAEDDERVIVVRGHIDGAAEVSRVGPTGIMSATSCRLEIKALGKDYYAKFKRHGHKGLMYDWQISTYMLEEGHPLLLVCGLKNAAGDGIEEITVEWIDKPPKSMAMLKARVLLIESGKVDACKERVYPCGFYWMDGTACSGDDSRSDTEGPDDTEEPLSDEATALFIELRDEWAAAKEKEAEAKKVYDAAVKERKTIETEMKAALDINNRTSVAVDGWQVEWIEGETRKGYVVQETTRSYLKVTAPKKERARKPAPGSQPDDDPFDGLS